MKAQTNIKINLRYHKACVKHLRLQISYKVKNLPYIPFNQINNHLEELYYHANIVGTYKHLLSNLAG